MMIMYFGSSLIVSLALLDGFSGGVRETSMKEHNSSPVLKHNNHQPPQPTHRQLYTLKPTWLSLSHDGQLE